MRYKLNYYHTNRKIIELHHRIVLYLNRSYLFSLFLWRSKFHSSKIICPTYQCHAFYLYSVMRNLRGLLKRCTACSFQVTARAFTGQHGLAQRYSLACILRLSLSNRRQNSLSYCQNARTTSMSKIISLGISAWKIIMSSPALLLYCPYSNSIAFHVEWNGTLNTSLFTPFRLPTNYVEPRECWV